MKRSDQNEFGVEFDLTSRLVNQGRQTQTRLKELDDVFIAPRDYRQDKESVRIDLGRVSFYPHQPKKSVHKLIPLGTMVLNRTLHFSDELGGPGHYTGQLDNTGQPHGFGKAWFYSSYGGLPLGLYIGGWKEGLFSGRGFLKLHQEEYLGNFSLGKRNGVGKETSSRTTYIGSWQDDVMTGRGQLRTLEGTYTGELKNGKPHGYGRRIYSAEKSASHDGFFKDGERHGWGIHKTSESKVVGQWRSGFFVPGSEE